MLQLYRGGRPALYVLASGCERFSGPIRWRDSNLVVVDLGTTVGSHKVIDAHAGVEVVCWGVYLLEGEARIPPDPFTGLFELGPPDPLTLPFSFEPPEGGGRKG
jgi:hypothetical protein